MKKVLAHLSHRILSEVQYPLFDSLEIESRVYIPVATKIHKKISPLRQRAVQGKFQLQNRRFLGNKYKLLEFIENIVDEKCGSCNSFCDIFAGTGMRNLKFNQIII